MCVCVCVRRLLSRRLGGSVRYVRLGFGGLVSRLSCRVASLRLVGVVLAGSARLPSLPLVVLLVQLLMSHNINIPIYLMSP